jgi:hypothetical protein
VAKAVVLAMPCFTLVTSSIRQDVQGTMEMVHRANLMLKSGFGIRFQPSKKQATKITSWTEDARERLSWYMRHYLERSECFDITSIFKSDKTYIDNACMWNLEKTISYGDVIEFSFSNVPLDSFFGDIHSLDSVLGRFFSSSVSRKLFEVYFGPNLLKKNDDEFFIPPILTVFIAFLITNSDEEFREICTKYGATHSLSIVLNDGVAIGAHPTLNFIGGDLFPHFAINPVVINFRKKTDHRFADILHSLLYLSISTGELYNILETMSDFCEMYILARPLAPFELYEEIGRFKINPIRDIPNFYGLKNFQKYEKLYLETMSEDVNYLRSYKTKISEIVQEKEGIQHFPGVTFLCQLLDDYSMFDQKIIFKKNTAQEFVTSFMQQFDKDFDDFKDRVSELFEDFESVIDRSRTAVQLNIAIIAIFWTIVFTVVLSPEVFPSLKAFAENLWKILSNYIQNLQSASIVNFLQGF